MKVFDFLGALRWLDGSPLREHIEPYRRRIFEQFFEGDYNLGLFGRAKKNWKSADLVLACLYAMLAPSPGGNQVYLVANDQGQAADDLTLAKLLLKVNPALDNLVKVKKNTIERADGGGFIEILPAQDIAGTHGKTYRLLGCDEIHAWKNWDLLEALAMDPTRPDCQQWITSYASLIHRPGAPLFDLLQQARRGEDPRLLLDWWAADFCTAEDVDELSPEERANPSMASWENDDYLEQQRRRLPSHKYRRLHLNLPGLPQGSAFQPEPVMSAVDRGTTYRPPEESTDPDGKKLGGLVYTYRGFVDMSGGSADDAVLAIGHTDADDRAIVDRVMDQGTAAPFDPRKAIARFVPVLTEYGIATVMGDRYAGETFRRDFEGHGIKYDVCPWTKSQMYEALEPRLNANEVVFPDVVKLEQQLLGLVWRGGKIDHPGGEHDDWANGAAGIVQVLSAPRPRGPRMVHQLTGEPINPDLFKRYHSSEERNKHP